MYKMKMRAMLMMKKAMYDEYECDYETCNDCDDDYDYDY